MLAQKRFEAAVNELLWKEQEQQLLLPKGDWSACYLARMSGRCNPLSTILGLSSGKSFWIWWAFQEQRCAPRS